MYQNTGMLNVWRSSLYLLILAVVMLAGCGLGSIAGGPTATSEPPTAPPETPTPEFTPTPETTAVQSLDDVVNAVVQIEAQGTFVDPGEGTIFNAAGRGSGFIIDESGLAVTNNHVVTGAALLKVYVGGDSSPRNAKVLGASECSDLALIDIEGDGYPYLEWYDDEIKVGLDVFAAGFPLGDPEFTLTRGIVSKARASGETSWSSIDNVIEHDATINPGNSGGPLITQESKVVGVNYAGSSDTNQYYAIDRDEASSLIEQLAEGEDITSIGINGEAFVTPEGDLSGIWVYSVKSGSPADSAGIMPGDILTKLERLVLATDGTMNDYCDILRSRDLDDTMAIEVIRPDTQQVFEGQLNGRELEESFSFAQQEETVSDDPGSTAVSYTEYSVINDEDNILSVEVPVEWIDVSSGNWVSGEEEIEGGIAVSAAPNLDSFANEWTTPGMFMGVSRSLAQQMTPDALLDETTFNSSCTYDGRNDYADALYTGKYDVWADCGGSQTKLFVVTFQPEDASFLGMVQIQVVSEADLEALDRIIDSFVVQGDF